MKKHLKILAIAALAFVRCGHRDLGNQHMGGVTKVTHQQSSHLSYNGNFGTRPALSLRGK